MKRESGERTWLLLFASIHHVLAAERTLEELSRRGELTASIELVPVPRELSSDCGMAVAVHHESPAPLDILLDSCNPSAVYEKKVDGYERIHPRGRRDEG